MNRLSPFAVFCQKHEEEVFLDLPRVNLKTRAKILSTMWGMTKKTKQTDVDKYGEDMNDESHTAHKARKVYKVHKVYYRSFANSVNPGMALVMLILVYLAVANS
jgi:hypothetical protein